MQTHADVCVSNVFLVQFTFLGLDTVLAAAFRILIVPGNFMQRPWCLEKITSITFQEKQHEYYLFKSDAHSSSKLSARFVLYCTSLPYTYTLFEYAITGFVFWV